MQRVSGELLRSGILCNAQRATNGSASSLLTMLRSGHFGRVCNVRPALIQSRAYVTKAAQEPFLNGSSSVYVEEMFRCWQKDPNSVHKSWDAFFRSAAAGLKPGQAYQSPPSISGAQFASFAANATQPATASDQPELVSHQHIDDHLSVQAIIRSYQVRIF